jgi:hypothetical protein
MRGMTVVLEGRKAAPLCAERDIKNKISITNEVHFDLQDDGQELA